MNELSDLHDPIPATDPSRPSRVVGFDIARTLALLGMFLVHFSMVAAADRSQPRWLASIMTFLDGRAATTFVILAGIGISLMSRRATAHCDPVAISEIRHTLIRRGLFLLLLGFLNLTIWAGDILRVYGISFLLASRLITASSRRLLILTIGSAITFAALLTVVDFEKNWDWPTLTYHNLWTPSGLFRNLFFDGFRSVLPWTGFITFGMWLGRLELHNPDINRRVFVIAISVAVVSEILSLSLLSYLSIHPDYGMDAITAKALFGTESMPALPLFVLSAGGTSTALIAICVRLPEIWTGNFWKPFSAMGQQALTWYLAHIVVGLGTLVVLDHVGTDTLPAAAGYGLMFFGLALVVSVGWKFSLGQGPMEKVMRRITG